PRAVALLTAGYSVGQILGPLVATPLLRHGYHQALILAAVVVLASAVAAALLRIGFPHHMPSPGHPVVRAEPAADRRSPGLGTAEARAD
ncbi:MFS transporter, partial [Streptomyces albiflaviniger]|nr:MFS transporter [Streptomyces albiflaviniger]